LTAPAPPPKFSTADGRMAARRALMAWREESPGSTEARCRVTPGGGRGNPEPQGKRHRDETAAPRSRGCAGKGETVG